MSEQREALAEWFHRELGFERCNRHDTNVRPACENWADRLLASDALAQMLAEAFRKGREMGVTNANVNAERDGYRRGRAEVAAAALAVVKRACDIECKSPGTHRQCTSHEPYRALTIAALTSGTADRVRAEAWDEGYRSAMTATIGMQGRPNQGASFPADWPELNPYRAVLAEEGGDEPRCQYVSPSPWGPTQCALPEGHAGRHAYSPSEDR